MLVREWLRQGLSRAPRVYEAALTARSAMQRQGPVAQGGGGSGNREQIFSSIYATNGWHDGESRSGPGSNRQYTRNISFELPRLLTDLNVKRLLDAPCGDMFWMHDVILPSEVTYVGADIVPALIDDLRERFSGSSYHFEILDIVRDPLPSADLWLCRDCLIHLPNEAALAALGNFARSDIKYLLITTYNFARNIDIQPGGFRMVNLRRRPFLLPRPILSFFDFIYPHPPRRLALYSNEQMKQWLRNNAPNS